MQAGDYQLGRDEEQDHCGDTEELLQINADAAFDEHHPEHNRRNYAEKRAHEAEQFG